MNKTLRITLVSIILLLIVGVFVYPKLVPAKKNIAEPQKNPGGAGRDAKVLPVSVWLVQPANITDKLSSTGTLLPEEEVDLSFETSGRITGIFFKEGTIVKKGDLLAKLNDARLQAQLLKLQAQLALSESKVVRQKALLEKEAVSKESYDQIVTETESLKADIQLVKAQIAETEMRAPFSGLIGLRYASEGTFASPGTKIAKLTKITPLKMQFSIPERFSGIIKKGSNITFSNDIKTYTANVYAVDSKIDEGTRTLQARALYPNTDGKLLPGTFVNVVSELYSIKDGMAVPAEAIIPEMGVKKVYLYKGGKAISTEITVGVRNESVVQVMSGINFGDTIITTGILQMRQSLPVSVENVINKQQ